MQDSTKYLIAFAVVTPLQIVFGATVLFLIRRVKKVEPRWSWLKMTGRYVIFYVLNTALTLVPVVGKLLAVIVGLVFVERVSGLDVLSAIILTVLMSLVILVGYGFIGYYFHVDLWGLESR